MGALSVFDNTNGFVLVPATAGHVIVAEPLVEPKPVMTQAVVLSTPQLIAEKSPTPGVVPPMVPGDANVAPPKLEAFKLATTVVLVTTNGAVPVATVEVN